MTWEEFEDLTPSMLWELSKRRNIRIRYDRYGHGMTTAAVYNTLRKKTEDQMLTAMDFCRTDEQAAKRERDLQAKQFIRSAVSNLPATTPREKFLEARARCIKKLTDGGFDGAEQLFDKMWPSLKPQEGE